MAAPSATDSAERRQALHSRLLPPEIFAVDSMYSSQTRASNSAMASWYMHATAAASSHFAEPPMRRIKAP